MWFGRVVPLLNFPLPDRRTDRSPHSPRHVGEERSMPLLNELCLGMSIEDGTALYVTYGINKDAKRWGDDLAGWFAIAPFPPRLFGTEYLMRLNVHLRNRPGAFQSGVTDPVVKGDGLFLYMEVLGTGDVGGLILRHPSNDKKIIDEIEKQSGKDDAKPVHGREKRRWVDDKDTTSKGWAEALFDKNAGNVWFEDRRVLVRERHIVIPYGEFWYNFDLEQKELGEEQRVESFMRPNYCLLARDIELPILLALVPARPLFRVDVDVSIREREAKPPGVGLLDRVVKSLSDDKINIWHVHHTFPSLIFKPSEDSQKPPTEIRGADSHISIVASVPKARGHDSSQAISAYLQNLRRTLMELRLPSDALGRVEELRDDIKKKVEEAMAEAKAKAKAQGGVNGESTGRLVGRVINANFNRLMKEVLEPPFVRDVDIHGPPLFRCFLSHSASPAYDERDHITRLKTILEAEVFEVVEGEFSLGQSTEALSRGRIRHCDLFVSFLWPRENFRRADGTFSPPEWIIHEESFAIGQNIPVYRVIEESVENPRYEQDRPPFRFKKNDLDSWSNLERAFRLEVRELALRILLGAHATAADKADGRGGVQF